MKPWPKKLRNAGYEEDFPPAVKDALSCMVAEGVQKVWFIQIYRGKKWVYLEKEHIAFRCRSNAKKLAIKMSESVPSRMTRIVRWIDPARRKLQMDLWRKRWSNREIKPRVLSEQAQWKSRERAAKQALRQAKKDFKEMKNRLQEAQEAVSRVYRNRTLGIFIE